MRNPVGLLTAIALVVVGVGVVRPHTIRLIHESWEPVVKEQLEVPLNEQASVEVSQLGDYVVFLEGPAGDPLWITAAETWVQMLDWRTHQPLGATRHGVDFSYELDGRRAQSISRVTVLQAGFYEPSLSNTDSIDLHARGFKLTMSPAKLVVEQSRRAGSLKVGGIAVGIVMGIIALSMLARRQS
jgi:hypothetical protein